jgi:hypothetical protein
VATTFKDTAANSLKALQSSLTKELQSDALSAGWPKMYANSLSVRINKSNIYIDYSEQLAQDIEDLEYGSESQPPKPILRLFIDRHSEDFQNIFAESSVNYLFDSGVLP